MFNSDGLPKFYTDVTESKELMGEMKREVFAALDYHGIIDAKQLCDLTDINIMFKGEVEDFIEDYKAYEAMKKAGVNIKSPNDVKKVV